MFSGSEHVVIKHFPSGKIFIELNGVGYTFASPDEMPPTIREAYDRHIGLFGTRLGASLRGGDGFVHMEKHVFGFGGAKQIPTKQERVVIEKHEGPRITGKRNIGKRKPRALKPIRNLRKLTLQPIRINRIEMCRFCGAQMRPVKSASGKRCTICGAKMV